MKRKILFFNLLILLSVPVFSTDYYVSTTGDDANDGSSGSPWLTISKAISSVATNVGDTIHLGAGTFTEANILKIPSGVSLIGAGSLQTTIVVNHYYTITDFNQWISPTYHPEHYVIQLNGSNQTIKGFSMDGQKKKVIGGIYAQKAINIVFDDLKIQYFKTGGIFIEKGHKDCEVKFCFIKNSSWATNSTGDTGNLMFDYGVNLSIHDNYIEEQGAISPDYGGYCIKRAQNVPQCDWYCENRMEMGTNDGYKIFNNTLIAPQAGAWNNGQSPAMTIEMCGGISKNCEIYNNNLNNCVSLVGQKIGGIYSGNSVRLHHNTWNMEHGRYAYAIEADLPGIEIDHNIFDGGETPIAAWDGRDKNDLYSHSVHHNVFYAPAQHIGGNNDLNFFLYNTPPTGKKGYQFYNNTLIDVYGTAHIFAVAGDKFENGDFRNNIFMSTFGNRGNIVRATGKTMTNNLFFNIGEVGTNNINGDPLLNLNGELPVPFFELKAGSPAIDAGVAIPGITDDATDGKPDLGAFEYGVPAWKAGIVITDSNAPSAPVGLSADPKSTYILLSWQASVDNNFIKEYEIYQNGILIGTTSNLTYKVNGLTKVTGYSFYVKGKDIADNVSTNSETVQTFTLDTDIENPSAPQNLSASDVTYKALVLTWNQATDNEEIKGYKIYKGGVLFKSTTTVDTLIALTGLTPSSAYSFSIKSVDLTGNLSDFSANFEVTTAELPDPFVTARGENAADGEIATNLADGNNNTKWLFASKIAWVQYSFKEPHVWNTYKIVSGNDDATRDFKTWTLKGSNDGMAWDSLDTKTNQNWSARNQSKTFTFLNANPYKLYKLNITANNGNIELIQASEITFSFNPSADIETISTPSSVRIYPNPSNGIVIVEFADNNKHSLSVFDVFGRELLKKKALQSKEQLDLSAFKGFLLLKVDNGQSTVTKSILIQ